MIHYSEKNTFRFVLVISILLIFFVSCEKKSNDSNFKELYEYESNDASMYADTIKVNVEKIYAKMSRLDDDWFCSKQNMDSITLYMLSGYQVTKLT